MAHLSRTESILIGIWLETFLYGERLITADTSFNILRPNGIPSLNFWRAQGLYTPLFFTCLWVMFLHDCDSRRRINWRLLGPTIAMFGLSTVHMAVSLIRLIDVSS